MQQWNWYISIHAIKQYMAIQNWGGELEESNPRFLQAQEDLRQFSLIAREVESTARSGARQFRANGLSRGRKARFEFAVMDGPRVEGTSSQLVHVRLKDYR